MPATRTLNGVDAAKICKCRGRETDFLVYTQRPYSHHSLIRVVVAAPGQDGISGQAIKPGMR
jgi:hypothetical protein